MSGRVALITAAGAGIGRAIAEEWGSVGGLVSASDIDGRAASSTAEAIRDSGGEALSVAADVTVPADVDALVRESVEHFGRLDVLFNVAGVNLPRTVEEMEDREWYRVMDTNLTSVYRCSRRALPELRCSRRASIVNVASTAGLLAENRCAAYTASKGGVVMLTRNMAMDLGRYGIRVNAICPGGTMTPRIAAYLEQASTEGLMEGLCPLGRFAEPREIAKPAVFLASDEASYVTGASLAVDGGMTAGIRIPLFDRID